MQIKKMHTSTVAATSAAVDKALNAMLDKAIAEQATDIHIEPRERTIVVRFRVDGLLHETAKLPLGALSALVANLKRRAGLDAKNIFTPQSGSFMYASSLYDTNITIATMPTINGEKIAVQLTPQLSEPATLESLGYWGEALHSIERSVAEPHGLIIATSPSKTVTSLSLLGIVHLLNNPALNITTIEDPIEHHIPGINQTQVSPAHDLSFASGLEAILKQDPNVVMVSDMHEPSTVSLALHAGLNGRLILGGLHTNSAAHGISHLLHMHSEPFLVATALRLATGQRLVRRLCPSCKEAYTPDDSARKDLKALLTKSGITTMKKLHSLELSAAEEGLGGKAMSSISTTPSSITTLWRAHTEGCAHCRYTGFSGRVGICEVLPNSDMTRHLIANQATTQAIQQQAIEEGMIPLPLDGLIKALRGLTSLEDILPLLHTTIL